MGRRKREPQPVFTTDPTGEHHGGLPTFIWKTAPPGYLTRRQLSAKGLRPGGQPVAAQVRRGGRIALLYREDLAKPKFTLTDDKLAAVWIAALSRQRCAGPCGRTALGYIPKQGAPCWGMCWDCTDQAREREQRNAHG